MKKIVMFMSLGTSFYTNMVKRFANDDSLRTIAKSSGIDMPVASKDIEAVVLEHIEKCYKICYPDFEEKLKNDDLIKYGFPSGELNSLYHWLNAHNDIIFEKLYLIQTKPDVVRACAQMLKNIIPELIKYRKTDYKFKSVEIFDIDLPVDKPERLPIDAADMLAQLYKEMCDLRKKGIDHFVLNTTAGYKIMMTLLSFFSFIRDDVELIYMYEGTSNFLNLPALPLNLDMKLFDEYRSLIAQEDVLLKFEPPSKLAALFNRETKGWVKNAFGAALMSLYDEVRRHRYGSGHRLMRFLSLKTRKKILNNIQQWEHIWMGDLIPETVEHSRRHSMRLLEYAADLLEPLFAVNAKFLTNDELYLLLCCFWLHDIGHTGLKFSIGGVPVPVEMYPTLVRRWHSFMSEDLILSARNYLPFENPNSNSKNIVALISKYHRSKLPLLDSSADWKDNYFPTLNVVPLERAVNSIPQLEPQRLLLICAILRICDALDVQVDRVVDSNYWKERRKRTQEEINYLFWRLREKQKLLGNCSKQLKSSLENLLNKIECSKNKWFSVDTFNYKDAQQIEDMVDTDVEPTLLALISGIYGFSAIDGLYNSLNPAEKEIMAEILSCSDRIAFKMRQEAHYYKHSMVKIIYLTYHDNKFQINMVFDHKLTNKKNLRQQYASGIWQELGTNNLEVYNILKENGIEFEGIYCENTKIYP